jgi:hypothetical protein
MLREAVSAVGSYKEIYEHNLEMDIPKGEFVEPCNQPLARPSTLSSPRHTVMISSKVYYPCASVDSRSFTKRSIEELTTRTPSSSQGLKIEEK